MYTWELLTFFLLLLLAGLTGCTLARRGVVNGHVAWLAGAFSLRVGNRRVILDTLQIRPGKVCYQVAIKPA